MHPSAYPAAQMREQGENYDKNEKGRGNSKTIGGKWKGMHKFT
jgi:hypothetical protein